jgi:transcriptional regulator with XRE-family HTH domain
LARRAAGEALKDIARTFGVSSVTVWRLEQASLMREEKGFRAD